MMRSPRKLLKSVAQRVTAGTPRPTAESSTPAPPLGRRLERFDAWASQRELWERLRVLLTEAGIEYVDLPAQAADVPVVVVSATDSSAVRTRIADAGSALGWGLYLRRGKDTNALTAVSAEAIAAAGDDLNLAPLVADATGRIVTSPLATVRLQFWQVVNDDETARRDGGTFLRGTRLAIRNRSVEYLEPGEWDAAQREGLHWPATNSLPHLFDVADPIDLVFTWVDGSDPAWRQRRAAAQDLATGDHPTDAFIAARYADHDELRYALRSVEMYANWVNHIWLVTDQQVPSWLRLDHPRLTVVDHREFFSDPTALPTFNSHAIESQVHKIRGLSTLYIYANDDTFFGRPVTPGTFFHGNGIAKLFPSSALLNTSGVDDRDVSVLTAAKRTRDLLERDFGRTFSAKLQHTPQPLNKHVLIDLEERHPDVFDRTMRSRFRQTSDYALTSSLAPYYAYATRRAVVGQLSYGYLDIAAGTTPAKLADWLERRPFDCFCLNDSGMQPEHDQEIGTMLSDFLNAYYPFASEFEKIGEGNADQRPSTLRQAQGRPSSGNVG